MQRRIARRRFRSSWPTARVIEALEGRQLLSLSAAGGEFLVNSYTTNTQALPAIAMDADGDFVLAWQSNVQDIGGSAAVIAQRFNSSGDALGAEFRVNTFTPSVQAQAAAAMDADGDFVIAWNSSGQDSASTTGVYAQRFNAAGVAQGGEFRVNTYTTGNQFVTGVAMNPAGDFVIAWQSSSQESAGNDGIYAQRYNAAGVPQGLEFHVNSYTTGFQASAAVAMDATGDFVIAWYSDGQDGSNYGVYAKRYNAAGVEQAPPVGVALGLGNEFRVNTLTTNAQAEPSVAMDYAGNFVIAWHSLLQDGNGYGTYAKRYNAAGAEQTPPGGVPLGVGNEFRVNTQTSRGQSYPSVGMDANGDFLVAWQSYVQEAALSHYGIYAQQYNAAGAALGSEFRVNTYTTSRQLSPAVASSAGGDSVVSWYGVGQQDTSNYGIYAQRYSESNPDVEAPMVGGIYLNNSLLLPYSNNSPSVSQFVVSFSEAVSDSGGAGGINSVTNPANWLITRNGIDISAGLSINYGFNPVANKYEATLTLTSTYTDGNFLVKVRDNLRDLAGHVLDGDRDGVAGGLMLLPFSVSPSFPVGDSFLVHSHTTAGQFDPRIARSANGDFVAVWRGTGAGADPSGEIYARRFNAAGVPQGNEFRVNTFTTGPQTEPAVAIDADGDFVVAWVSFDQAPSGLFRDVYMQRFDEFGAFVGPEVLVNTDWTPSNQSSPSVAMSGSGDIVVAWQSGKESGQLDYGIYAKRYDSAGVAQGSEFRVNTYTTGAQFGPAVVDSGLGAFIVTWVSEQPSGNRGVYAQRYGSSGSPLGSEFRVDTSFEDKFAPDIAVRQIQGDFVVTWQSSGQDASGSGIYARRYSSAGVAQGGEFRINTYTTGDQSSPAIAMDVSGNFIVAWNSNLQDGSGRGIFAKRYSSAGVAQGVEFQVNSYTTSDQVSPDIVFDDDDAIAVWSGAGAIQSGTVYGQRFSLLGLRSVPTVGSLSDNPDPVTIGNSITLSASGITTGGTTSRVSFYRESNGEPGLQVGADGDTPVGTDTTESGGFWSVNVTNISLPVGPQTYWAQATDEIGLTGPPASTTNSVSLGITAAGFHYDTLPQKLMLTFNGNVSGSLGLEDIALVNISDGAVPTLTMLSYGTDGPNVASFSMDTQLVDGNYRATITAAGINDGVNPMAGNYVFDFFILTADADHNRVVDVRDLYILSQNWLGTGKTFTQADFNYDTLVNKADLTILAQAWQQELAEPAAAFPASPAPTVSRRAPTRTAVRVIELVQ